MLKKHYTTKQREAVLLYLQTMEGEHLTAAQIGEHFKSSEMPISTATVYRCLDQFVADGEVRRYALNGNSSAQFEYITSEVKENKFHLKCENCGRLMHFQCELLEDSLGHLFENHLFKVNMQKSVLYGECEICSSGAVGKKDK